MNALGKRISGRKNAAAPTIAMELNVRIFSFYKPKLLSFFLAQRSLVREWMETEMSTHILYLPSIIQPRNAQLDQNLQALAHQ